MTIRFEKDAQVARVTIDRPEAMNAIDSETRAELREVYAEIASDTEIRVALLTGAGEKSFCAGADLKKTMPTGDSMACEEFGGRSDHLLAGFPVEKPVVCAINGYALGGGLELALMCDIRVASSTATFGLPEVRRGTIPGSSGTQMLPRIVGRAHALRLILTGDRIDAEEAFRIGLVGEVVEPGALQSRANEIAHRIAHNAPLAVVASKKLVMQSLEMPLASGMALERYAFGLLRDSEDRIEGRTAFAEKREPHYQGR